MMLSKEKKDFLIILFGKILQIPIMIISVKVLTTLLSPREMGTVYLFTAIYTFFVLSLISPVGQYINRHTHKWQKEKSILDNLSLYILYLVVVSFFAMVIGYFLHISGIINSMNVGTFILLLFLFTFFLTLNQTILPLLNMLHFRLSFTLLTLLTVSGVISFGYMFVYKFGAYAQNWLYGIVLSNIIFTIIGFVILRRNIGDSFSGMIKNIKNIKKEKILSILKFVIPLSIGTLFMWAQNNGYRLLIEQNIGLSFLGFLGVGMAVSSKIAGVIESIVMQYYYPIYYQKITKTSIETRKRAINELINKILPIYFMLALFVTFFSKYIVEILVDSKYSQVYIFTMFGIWIEFFRMFTNILGNISQSEMNTKKFMIPYIAGSVTTLICVYFASINEEYEFYLPIALMTGGFFTMITMYWSMKKLINFSINFKMLFLSLFISMPYISAYWIHVDDTLFNNMTILVVFGFYFLGTIFFVYQKGLKYDYS